MKSFLWCVVYSLLAALVVCSSALFKAYAASTDYFPNVCTDIRNGMPLAGVETLLTARGYSEWDAGAFTGTEIKEHCPDVTATVLSQVRP